jgi:hypothetical protein
MSDSKSQLATFRIEPELWESFKAQARKNGKTASDVLIDFVQSYVEGGGVIGRAMPKAIASTETPQLDNLDSHIDERVAEAIGKAMPKAIAPLQRQLDELRTELGECVA